MKIIAVFERIRRNDVRRRSEWLRRAVASLVRWGGGGDAPPSEALTRLSPSARALLRRFLEQDATTLSVNTVASVVIGLELADVISIARAQDPAAEGGAFLLTVNPWALKALRLRPELLGPSELRRATGASAGTRDGVPALRGGVGRVTGVPLAARVSGR